MTNRERLTALLMAGAGDCYLGKGGALNCSKLADYLLEHGVTVTPCKVGDTVYIPWHWNNKNGIAFAEVEEIKIYDINNHYMFLIDLQSDDEEFNQLFGGWKIEKSIGETVFLTREEAERALKECENNA